MDEEPDLATQRNDELHGIWVVLFWMLVVGTLGGWAVNSADPSPAAQWIGGALGAAVGFGVSWYASQSLPLSGVLKLIPLVAYPPFLLKVFR
jgi:hypothetical protein